MDLSEVRRLQGAIDRCRHDPDALKAVGKACSGNNYLTAALLALCYWDIELFNVAVLGRDPFTDKQREMARLVVEKQKTVIVSANACGKTWMMQAVILWWLYTRKNSVVLTTAPNQQQLNLGLWAGIRGIFDKGLNVKLPGKVSSSEKSYPQQLVIGPEWYAVGISTTSTERISGMRSKYGNTLIVVDECSGVDDAILEGLASIGAPKTVYIGNPLSTTNRFYSAALAAQQPANASEYGYLKVTAFDSPDIDKPTSSRGMACQGWLNINRIDYGEGSLWWRAHVLAEFCENGEECLVPTKWLDLALDATHVAGGPVRIGVDLATGSGCDKSAILVRDDNGIYELVGSDKWTFEDTAGKVAELARRYKVEQHRIVYDANGPGHSFASRLLAHGIRYARGYNGSFDGGNSSKYANLRSGTAWRIRTRLDPGRVVEPPKTPEEGPVYPQQFAIKEAHLLALRPALQAITYSLNSNGAVTLEPAEKFKNRFGKSPDAMSALQISYCYPD